MQDAQVLSVQFGAFHAAETVVECTHGICPVIGGIADGLQRLGWQRNDPRGVHYDVLELFAFVRPAQAVAPSVGSLARAMGPRRLWSRLLNPKTPNCSP